MSSSATLTVHGKDVAIISEPAVDASKAIASSVFQDWLKKMEAEARFDVRKVHFQSIDMFGPRVGFLKFKAEVACEGTLVPGIVFARGGAVAVLVVLTCDGEEYALLTVQPRVPIAQYDNVELPAGMLDGSGHFAGVAAKEIEEETGIKIDDSELIDLTELAYGDRFGVGGIVPSGGGCDETIRLFLFKKNVTQPELEELKGKLTGLREHGELISLKVVKLSNLWKETNDSKALCALQLLSELKREGKL